MDFRFDDFISVVVSPSGDYDQSRTLSGFYRAQSEEYIRLLKHDKTVVYTIPKRNILWIEGRPRTNGD